MNLGSFIGGRWQPRDEHWKGEIREKVKDSIRIVRGGRV